MILHIRGAHGAGKSTIVKQVMANARHCRPVMIDGRKQPIGYVCFARNKKIKQRLFVVGHYNTACGGGDTIPSVIDVFDLVRKYEKQGMHVIFEGTLAQHGIPHLFALKKSVGRANITVIHLKTSVKKCIRSVIKRRLARGNTKPFNPDHVIKDARSMDLSIPRMKAGGLRVKRLTRYDALTECLTQLGWEPYG